MMNPRCNQRWAAGAVSAAHVVVVVLLAAFLGGPGRAWAQDGGKGQLSEEQKRKASEHYEKATRLYNVGKYGEAVQEYENAYLISADPVMLYNIAQCHRLNGQPEEAIRFYKNYLRNAPNASATVRADAEKKIAEMEKAVEEKRRTGGMTNPGATPPPVNPVVTAPPLNPPPPDPITVPPPVNPPPQTSGTVGDITQQPPPTEEPPKKSKVLPVVLLVSGGVLLATSVGLGAVAASKAKEVERRSKLNVAFDSSVKNLETAGKNASNAAVLTGLVGVAAGVTGVIFLVKANNAAVPAETATQAMIFPVAGPGVAGAGARFTF